VEEDALMFFVLSKTAGFLLLPSNLLVALALVGLVMMATRWRRAGTHLMAGALVVLVLAAYLPLGRALGHVLESRFPAWDPKGGAPDGIVVLGGAITPDVAAIRNDAALNEAAERMTATVELARRYPNARVIFSGGDGSLVHSGNESEAALRLFERLGLAAGRVAAEDRSRNTVENAVFSKQIASPKPSERWLLVTSAYHMPRAMGIFRMAGFPVEAYPVDWRTRGAEDALRPFPTLAEGLRRTDTAVREWAGLLVYWLAGRSSELFPAPREGP
jgi:uncharacterized SAM-binding protein YcdF (DUF218 family)